MVVVVVHDGATVVILNDSGTQQETTITLYISDWFRCASQETFGALTALKELRVAVDEGVFCWGMSLVEAEFSEQLRENTKFGSLITDLMLNMHQIYWVQQWHWDDGGKVQNVHDLDDQYD